MAKQPMQDNLVQVTPPSEREELACLCKALSHPVRIQIVQFLRAINEACVCGDIVTMFPLAQSTVSQHLKVLKDAELIVGEIDGPRTCYSLNREKWERWNWLVAHL